MALSLFCGGAALCIIDILPWLGGIMIFAVMIHSMTYGESPWGA